MAAVRLSLSISCYAIRKSQEVISFTGTFRFQISPRLQLALE
jgi:hypothetical protein